MHKWLLWTLVILVAVYVFRNNVGSFLTNVGAGTLGGYVAGFTV